MRERRRFLAIAAACALASSVPARAQRVRAVGLLTPGSGSKYLAAALAQHGWSEGTNIRFEVRRAALDGSDADELAAQLVRAAPDVLVASTVPFVLALHRATRSIPIVCGGISDPVGEGVARTLQRPGMNVTGLSFGLPEAAVLQVGALRALVPRLTRLLFVTTKLDEGEKPAPAHEAAAKSAGISAELVEARDMDGVERVLKAMRPATEAAWIGILPRDAAAEHVAAAAVQRRIATHGIHPGWVRAGMLMSYWIVHADPLQRVAAIVDKVLRGADPGQIPFELPGTTQFAINRATATAIGLKIPEAILLRATETIG
jgi:putative ABC transport system substrate-binding protein